MRPFYLAIFIILNISLNGQSIKGKILDGNSPIPFANVMLYKFSDTTLIKFAYSDDDGIFIFEDIAKDEYFIETSYVGLENYRSKTFNFTSADLDLGTVVMKPSNNQIEEIVVTARKPMMEIKPDMVVLNVAGSVLATGDDALSLLRKAPGVMVDNNESITLLGKSGLVIYIDGKPSPLTSTELANMLKSMSANDIESIEIISNPSAKYEAQGTAGIINIKRKKISDQGVNGTVNTNFRQGITTGYNAGLNLNYRNEKFNLFGNGSYYHHENENKNIFTRKQNNLGFFTNNKNISKNDGINVKIAGDYYYNKKNSIGFIAEVNMEAPNQANTSYTELGSIDLLMIDSLLINNGKTVSESRNTNLNINYYFDGGNGNNFNIDANYGRYDNHNNSYSPNIYMTPDRQISTSSFEVRTISPTVIDITNLKMDYETKLGSGIISGGLKSAMVKTDNKFEFYNFIDKKETLNTSKSNGFLYDEWVNAAYLNFNSTIGKLSYNLGLRVENSNTKGVLTTMNQQNDKTVKREYINFFPSLGISYAPSEKHSFQWSYGRRINRPNYQDLNPFEFQLDQLTFEKGNAFLNPEYTDNIQMTHTYASKVTTSINYSHTSNVITRLVDTSGLKGTFITWDNIAYRKIFALTISSPFSITEKWNTYTSLSGTHTKNYANFDDGKKINIDVSSFNLYHQQSFAFSHGWSAEISGWYSSPSIWEGTFKMNAQGAIGAGFSKKFADGKSKLTLSVDDIFKTNVWTGISTFGGLEMSIRGNWDSRRVKIGYSYSFGTQSKLKSRKRSTGSEEEQQRIK